MNKSSKVVLGLALSLMALAGCPKKSLVAAAGGGGGDEGGGAALGDTMADAVVYQRGASFTAPVLCHTSSYAKLMIPGGEAVKLEVTVTTPKDEACVGFGVLNQNGGDGGVSDEACSTESPLSYDITASEGATFLQISENGVCQGATVTVAIK